MMETDVRGLCMAFWGKFRRNVNALLIFSGLNRGSSPKQDAGKDRKRIVERPLIDYFMCMGFSSVPCCGGRIHAPFGSETALFDASIMKAHR